MKLLMMFYARITGYLRDGNALTPAPLPEGEGMQDWRDAR